MASGKNHIMASMMIAATRAVVFDFEGAAGAFLTVIVNPDLDIDRGNMGMSLVEKTYYPAGIIWRHFWRPYALLIKHRSPISHFPVLSTVLRLVYMYPLIYLFNKLLGGGGLQIPVDFVLWMIVSDIAHWLMDFPVISKFLGE